MDGGGFIMPSKKYDKNIEIDMKKIHYGKQDSNGSHSNFRSATPLGFAKAVFESNKIGKKIDSLF